MIKRSLVSADSINHLLNVLNTLNTPVSIDKDTNEIVIQIVNTLNTYHGLLLCDSAIISHDVFAKLIIYYRLLLKECRQHDHSSNESLSKLHSFLCRLSINITETNVHIFKKLFFKNSLIEEISEGLNDITIGKIVDPSFISIIDSIIASFYRLYQNDTENIPIDSLHEQLINAIVQYINSIKFHEDIMSINVTLGCRMILTNCLHYVANLKTSFGHHWQTIITRTQLQPFAQWIEEISQFSIDWWTQSKVKFVDYFITIFSIQLNGPITNEEQNLYVTLFDRLAHILFLSKDSENYCLTDTIIKELFIFSKYKVFGSSNDAYQAIIPFLCKLINDAPLPPEQDDNVMLHACCILINFDSYNQDDVENLVFILIDSLSKIINRKDQSDQVNMILCHLKLLLLSRYKFQTREELNCIESLFILRQCSTSYESFDVTIRQRAMEIFYAIMRIPAKKSNIDIDSIIKLILIPDVPVEKLVIYDWSLDNWKKTNDVITFLVPFILQNFEETKLLSSKQKIQERCKRKSLKDFVEYNREDTTIVWIYNGKTIKESNLLLIQRQLNLIRDNGCYFDGSKDLNSALDYILCRQSERIFVLIDYDILYSIIDQLFRGLHLSLFIYLYNSTKDIPMISLVAPDIQDCITALAMDIELSTVHNIEFLVYESKQTKSMCDLTNSSSHFLWHLLLAEILQTMPSGNYHDFVSAVRYWYSTNAGVLNEIDYFEMTYDSETPEIWYNSRKPTFIQRILQHAFKKGSMDTIYVARSIIIDLIRKIKFAKRSNEQYQAFVGTIMSKKRLEFLYNHQDSLLTPIGFLIGYTNRDSIITYLQQKNKVSNDNHSAKVLFEIDYSNISILNLSDDSILFNIGIYFRILNVNFDSTLNFYCIHLEAISNNDICEELIDSYTYLKSQAGEYVDRDILFGLLLVDMNCIRSATNYLLYYYAHDSDNKEIEIHKLATLGRISLRCNKLVYAEEFLLNAYDLFKKSQSVIEDRFIGRLRLDIVSALIQQNRKEEATVVCRETLLFLCDSPVKLSLTLFNLAQCQLNFCNIDPELGNASFTQLMEEYEAKDYVCQHSVLLGSFAIEIGDMYREQNLLDMASKSYLFSYSLSERNQPMNHPMALACLHRLSVLPDLTSVSKKLEVQLAVVYQEVLSDDYNDESNNTIADIGRRLALHFIKVDDYSSATRWFQMCLSIYWKQWPLQEHLIHQCQANFLKDLFGLPLHVPMKTPSGHHSLELNDIARSVSYMRLVNKPKLQEKLNEENHRWDEAMANWKRNCDINSGVMIQQLVIWIDSRLEQEDYHNVTYDLLLKCPHVDFHHFEDADSAVFYLMRNHEFTHARIILTNDLADDFFDMQEIARLQIVACLTMCVFIRDADEQEELDRYDRYLAYMPCRRKCQSKERYHYERCLIMSRDEHLLQEFSLQTDTLGSTIASTIFLVDVGAFGNMFSSTVDHERNNILFLDEINDHEHIEFIGYISGYGITMPKVLHHLRFPAPTQMTKNDVQITALVLFGRRQKLTDRQIALLCRYFSTGNCVRSITFIKYLVHLWSLESPISFYRLVNLALAECSIQDIHYLRYVIYDYFEMFYAKLLPYFSGTLYRSISMTEENIAILMSLEGQKIYFVSFTATSKNCRRAQLGGNVLFEIETLSSKSQEAQKLYSNADISIVSQFPEEEEVLYAPLATFRLVSIVRDDDEYHMEHYTVKLQELGGSSFLSILHIDKIKRMPNASPFLMNTDYWQIPISEDERKNLSTYGTWK